MKILYHFLLGCTILFSATPSFCQNKTDVYQPDARLQSCFDASRLNQMTRETPELILYYNYFLSHSYYTTSLNAGKPVTGTDITTVKVRAEFSGAETQFFNLKSYDANTFNPLFYDFGLDQNNFTSFLWKDAGIAVVFYPLNHISAEFKKWSENINK